jgi:PadR family transcriptional regulator AphA
MIGLTYVWEGELAMSFKHTLLGLLNVEPLSGYDIKKIVEKTPFMYWSGNNNQIYSTLSELLAEGQVIKETQHQEGAPSRKVYSITQKGVNELNRWLTSDTDAPVLRRQILVKLALASHLSRAEAEEMLDSYARTVRMEMALADRHLAQSRFSELPAEQAVFLELIRENIASLYSAELNWLEKVREAAEALPELAARTEDEAMQHKDEVKETMNCQVKENGQRKYLHVTGGGCLLSEERDALDIISQCVSHGINAVLIEGELSEGFLKLSTGVAGAVLQKFVNYNIRAAVVHRVATDQPLRFREMMAEQRSGNTFRMFDSTAEAAEWLLSD